jgi:hypothetical protein
MSKVCVGEGPIGQAYVTLGESAPGQQEQAVGLSSLVDTKWRTYEESAEYAEFVARLAAKRQVVAEQVTGLQPAARA